LFYSPRSPRYLHSFPTRRSSDLFNCRHGIRVHKSFQIDKTEGGSCASFHTCRKKSLVLTGIAHLTFRHLVCFRIKLRSIVRASLDRKSTRLNSSHVKISYAVFCL